MWGHGTKEHDLLMGLSRSGQWLHLMVLKVFSNLNDSMSSETGRMVARSHWTMSTLDRTVHTGDRSKELPPRLSSMCNTLMQGFFWMSINIDMSYLHHLYPANQTLHRVPTDTSEQEKDCWKAASCEMDLKLRMTLDINNSDKTWLMHWSPTAWLGK